MRHVILLAILVLGGTAASADDPPASAENDEICAEKALWRDLSEELPTPAELKIENALDAKAEFHFNGDPLTEVLSYVQELSGVPMWIEEKKIEEAAIDTSVPVVMSVSGIPLRDALRLLLEREVGGLTYLVGSSDVRGILIITTEMEAEREIEGRLYDVTGLKEAGYSPEKLSSIFRKIAIQKGYAGGDDLPELIIEDFPNAILISGQRAFHEEVTRLLNLFALQACPNSAVHNPPPVARPAENADAAVKAE